MQLKYSKDDQVLGCVRASKDGRRKWETIDALDLAESRRLVKKVVGDVRGLSSDCGTEMPLRAGIGYVPVSNNDVVEGSKKHRGQIVEALRAEQNESYQAKAVTL